ncbi:hypothetical protein ACJX0J_033940 [Zea mays]
MDLYLYTETRLTANKEIYKPRQAINTVHEVDHDGNLEKSNTQQTDLFEGVRQEWFPKEDIEKAATIKWTQSELNSCDKGQFSNFYIRNLKIYWEYKLRKRSSGKRIEDGPRY